jgi:hypothetical protein
MADDLGRLIGSAMPTAFTPSARHRDAGYGLSTLQEFGSTFGQAVLRGEVGRTSATALARQLFVPVALVEALLQQADGADELNFLAASVLRAQMRELIREVLEGDGPRRIVFARTQPTSPLHGVRVSFAGKEAFGLTRKRPAGAFDSIFATFPSPLLGGHEESINLGGFVPALEKDRVAYERGVDPMGYLSPLQHLSLTHPTAAMLKHAGAVHRAIREEIPAGVDASRFIFLQGRCEGHEENAFLLSPTRTRPIVSEPGYQAAAREALGDEVDILIQAEGSTPHDEGLELRHEYVDAKGKRVVPNRFIRDLLSKGRNSHPYELDKYVHAEHRGMTLMLFPGKLRAKLPGGKYEGGQALLQMKQDDSLRWFVLVDRAGGDPAWDGSDAEKGERLQQLAEDFALLEAGDSTAGYARRMQYKGLTLFDVPMSNPSGRENVWRLAAAVRQSRLPEGPLEIAPIG